MLSPTRFTNIVKPQSSLLSAYHLIVDDFDLFEDFPSFIRFRHNFGLPLAISSTSSVSSASFLFRGKSDCISDRWSAKTIFRIRQFFNNRCWWQFSKEIQKFPMSPAALLSSSELTIFLWNTWKTSDIVWVLVLSDIIINIISIWVVSDTPCHHEWVKWHTWSVKTSKSTKPTSKRWGHFIACTHFRCSNTKKYFELEFRRWLKVHRVKLQDRYKNWIMGLTKSWKFSW